jgi:hypothetical protein
MIRRIMRRQFELADEGWPEGPEVIVIHGGLPGTKDTRCVVNGITDAVGGGACWPRHGAAHTAGLNHTLEIEFA